MVFELVYARQHEIPAKLGSRTQEQDKKCTPRCLVGLNFAVDWNGPREPRRWWDESTRVLVRAGHSADVCERSPDSVAVKRGKSDELKGHESGFCRVFLSPWTCLAFTFAGLACCYSPVLTSFRTICFGTLHPSTLGRPKESEVFFFSRKTEFSSTSWEPQVFVEARVFLFWYCWGHTLPCLAFLWVFLVLTLDVWLSFPPRLHKPLLPLRSVLMYRIFGVFSNTHFNNKCE